MIYRRVLYFSYAESCDQQEVKDDEVGPDEDLNDRIQFQAQRPRGRGG
jgi:hypothetical protein